MDSIVEMLHKCEGLLSLGKVESSDIEKAETELSVSFAPEYREYTSSFGAVSLGGKEYTGAVKPANLNVVGVTKSARSITPSAKANWYVVMDPHFDGVIIWQDGEGKIYQTAPGTVPKEVAKSLAEYMFKA